jgi:4'-phosphopantetheinyl transferase
MFFDFWTLKEAYIKARGMGLSIPLDGFSFLLSDNDRPRITFHDGCPDQPERWDFVLYRSEGYRAAVAFSAGSPERSRVVHREIVPLGSEEGGIIYRAMDIPPS